MHRAYDLRHMPPDTNRKGFDWENENDFSLVWR